MLIQYMVSNYKSIGHPIQFSMFPAKESIDRRFIKGINTVNGEWKVLNRGGVFGPNAAGKSSFVKSIKFARNFIVDGQKSGKGIKTDQFRGEFEDLRGVSVFQFVFNINGDIYEYGFSVNRVQVCEEWLMKMEISGMEPLFTRLTNQEGVTQIEVESRFVTQDSEEGVLIDILKKSIGENQKNQLFLYKLYDNGIKKVEPIMDWFKRIQIITPDTKIKALPIRMQTDEELRDYIGTMLSRMDTGIFGVSIANEEIDFTDFTEKYHVPEEVIEDIQEIQNGILNLEDKYFIFAENNKKRTVLVQIKCKHKLNNKEVQLDIEDESDGTQRLLDLLPMLFSIRSGKEMIYIVDEIDRSLHTKLSQFLLNEFVNYDKESGSQIIFTAHDVNLINTDNFRTEEIWFIEKNSLGESKLRSLSDFHLEEGQDALKGYLNGRFGAVPVIREVM